jgi:hypothetical protein
MDALHPLYTARAALAYTLEQGTGGSAQGLLRQYEMVCAQIREAEHTFTTWYRSRPAEAETFFPGS